MKLASKIYYQLYESCAFVLRLITDVCCRVKKPRCKIRRAAIVTRQDLFPANHGGAVKIVETAKHLSFHFDEVLVITQSRYDYLVFRRGEVSVHAYPMIASWAFWVPFHYLSRNIDSTGFPKSERFLALPVCDRNFKFRVLYLAVRRPFDIMQAEFSPYVFACDWASRIYPDLPKITVEHNVEFRRIGTAYDLSSSQIEMMKQVEIEACRSCDRVVAVSEVDREALIQYGVPASRMAVIPLGVDLSDYGSSDPEAASEIRREYGLHRNDFIIMFHGVLHYKPNYEAVGLLAKEIMPRLRAMGCPVKCLVIGSSPPTEFAADDIILTGPVDRLPPFIQLADVAVVPLLEGGGTRLKILEYFASGVPVISTTKGAEGIRAESGKEILIEDTMSGIADRVNELRLNSAKRMTVGENGRLFAREFGWDRLAAVYCQLYAEITESNPNLTGDRLKFSDNFHSLF